MSHAVFMNITIPMLIAFAISAITGKFLIPALIRMKAQQTERDDGPKSHLTKTGTPNMGGLMILAGLLVSCLVFAIRDPEVLPVLFLTLGFGLVGFIDDFLKVKKRSSDGLSVKQKMALQIVISIVFGLILVHFNEIDLSMKVPFAFGVVVDFGRGLELPLTPMVGEYANMTHFISDEDAVSRLETFTSTERAHKVAAFTDGIQRLALNMLDNSPHVPFFTPFFNGLAAATQEQLDLLPELLKQFLSSPAVNERTDDDKTLALALWLP